MARLQEAIDAEISSGRLTQSLRDGETLSANPDGSLDYIKTAPGPDSVEFPDDGQPGQDRLGTADELDAEAASLELGVGAARIDASEEYEANVTRAVQQRDEAARQRKAAEAGLAEAERQVTEKRAIADRIGADRQQLESAAAAARSSGEVRRAEELAEKHERLGVEERAARKEVAAASAAADSGRTEVTRRTQQEAEQEALAGAAFGRQQRLEDVFDQQEDQARVFRQSANEMREAERLDAAAADLRSRGVAGVERVEQAAAEHRAKAEALRYQADDFDRPAGTVNPDQPEPPREIKLPPPVFDELDSSLEPSSFDVTGGAVAAIDDDDAGTPADDTAAGGQFASDERGFDDTSMADGAFSEPGFTDGAEADAGGAGSGFAGSGFADSGFADAGSAAAGGDGTGFEDAGAGTLAMDDAGPGADGFEAAESDSFETFDA